MPDQQKTIHFVSLGCPKNRVDTEVMLGISDDSGYTLVENAEDAKVIVINTCGFIGPAKEESIQTILEASELKKKGTCQKLVVSGCLSQRYPSELAEELPEVDHFLGSSDMPHLKTLLKEKAPRLLVGNPAEYTMKASDPRRLSQWGHSAYLKIAEGCNRSCSFCAIPSFRGKQRSRAVEDIVLEASKLAEQGVKEINLISQDTIAFGRDLSPRTDLATLTEALTTIEGLEWIRLHYLYPETLTNKLIDLFVSQPKVLPYIDMPLQHVSDNMLTQMRRGHGGKRIYQVVEKLKEQIPDLVFRTSFIVGHPGETEADFKELVEFMEWAKFDHVGVFLYSHEDNTHSGQMTELVHDEIIQSRQEELMAIQQPISQSNLQKRVGDSVQVLVDGISDESDFLLEGRFWGQAPEVDGKVYLANGTARPGEIRQARVTAAADYDLLADLLTVDGIQDAPLEAPTVRKNFRLPTV